MKAPTRESILARFWSKVDKSGKNGCWIWMGWKYRNGYGYFSVRETNMMAHRASYMFLVGEIPHGMVIDHICFNHACVNPDHLRLATRAGNAQNSRDRKNNTSGYKGVYWHQHTNSWKAQITCNCKKYHIGLYTTPEAAYAAYCETAKRMHGEFANLGKGLEDKK